MSFLVDDGAFLLNTRFRHMARNTIDYWMAPDHAGLSEAAILDHLHHAPVSPRASLQLYIHIPFCAQQCSFCAFSGGNSLDFKQAERYIDNLLRQMDRLLPLAPVYGQRRIRSVHIGGGSPDLVGAAIGTLLAVVRQLDGIDEHTEIAVECAPATVRPAFLDALVEHRVTKVSFGIQSINPDIRRAIRMPASLKKTEALCTAIAGHIPIINADFITGLPGQSLADVDADLAYAIAHPQINAVSTYLLTPGAAPALIADVTAGAVAAVPDHVLQARMRLHSYTTLQQAGWVRRGTNTYLDRARVPARWLDTIPGHECIGAAHYDDFLMAFGAQAIGTAPGLRFENIVNIHQWQDAIEAGGFGFSPTKSAIMHQRDMSLWTFPLFYQGLEKNRLEAMREAGVLDGRQLATLAQFINEGLVVERADRYQLSILGEVFMGHLVRLLKTPQGQQVLDDYIDEGYRIADALKAGTLARTNAANDRQTVLERLA